MTSCSVAECERAYKGRGFCQVHYMRNRRHGSPLAEVPARGPAGEGSVTSWGYRVLFLPDHPLASRRAQHKIEEHRVVLFAKLGPGEHPCHWCGKTLTWRGRPSKRICTDHLDFDRLNNVPSNLVPSCLDCNTKRVAA